MTPPLIHVEGWSLAFSMFAFGGVMIWVALLGLAEYRKALLANPRSLLSIELLMQLLFHAPTAVAFLCGVALLIGLLFFSLGLLLFALMVAEVLSWGIGRVFPALVSQFPIFGSAVTNGR